MAETTGALAPGQPRTRDRLWSAGSASAAPLLGTPHGARGSGRAGAEPTHVAGDRHSAAPIQVPWPSDQAVPPFGRPAGHRRRAQASGSQRDSRAVAFESAVP